VNVLTVVAMFIRNLALLAIFAHAALLVAVFPLAVMAGIAGLVLWSSRRSPNAVSGEIKLSSPLSIKRVLEFGALFVLIQVVGTIASRKLGNFGFLVVSALGGLFSSASSTVAAANLAARGSISPGLAGTGAVLASIASAIVNIPLVAKQAKDPQITRRVTAVTVVQALAGVAALFLQHYLMRRLR
jgi:uncharacterized membrane protein (DUF4010 family)